MSVKKQSRKINKAHVKDNGIGISKDNQKNLFQKFYQVNASTTREHGGSALDYPFVKE